MSTPRPENGNTIKRTIGGWVIKAAAPFLMIVISGVCAWAGVLQGRIDNNEHELHRHNTEREAMKTELKFIQKQLDQQAQHSADQRKEFREYLKRIEDKIDNR